MFIFRWSVDHRALAEPSRISIPRSELTRYVKGKAFRPTGIERHPVTGTYFLLSADESAIAEVTPAGVVLGVQELPEDEHRQPEGITLTSDLTLIIADEGSGRGRITSYRPSP